MRMKRLKRERIAAELERIYRQIPASRCAQCGTCCLNTPDIFYVEYLNIHNAIRAKLPHKQHHILKMTVDNAFLDAVVGSDYPLYCPLYEQNRCLLYEDRPYHCRVWGYKGREEYERDLRLDNEEVEENRIFLREAGLDIDPKDIFSIPYCERAVFKEPFTNKDAARVADELSMLEAAVIRAHRQPVSLSFPNNLAIAIFGDERFLDIRLKVGKEYLDNGRKTGPYYDALVREALEYVF